MKTIDAKITTCTNLDKILYSYKSNPTKDNVLDLHICEAYSQNYDDGKYAKVINTIMDIYAETIKSVCDHETIANSIYNWYDKFAKSITNNPYDTYLANIHEWFVVAKTCKLLDEKYIVNKMNGLYNKYNRIDETIEKYSVTDFSLKPFFEHINYVIDNTVDSFNQYKLITNFKELVMCTMGNPKWKDDKLVMLLLNNYLNDKVYLSKYSFNYLFDIYDDGYFGVDDKFDKIDSLESHFEIFKAIPRDVVDIRAYITAHDPGFDDLVNKLAILREKHADTIEKEFSGMRWQKVNYDYANCIIVSD